MTLQPGGPQTVITGQILGGDLINNQITCKALFSDVTTKSDYMVIINNKKRSHLELLIKGC